MKLIIKLLITAGTAFVLTKYFLDGVSIESFGIAVIFAIVLGLLNTFVKPILKFFGAPLTLLTLGLFALIINAGIMLIADYFIDGMHIDGFLDALIFSILLSCITSLLNGIFVSKED